MLTVGQLSELAASVRSDFGEVADCGLAARARSDFGEVADFLSSDGVHRSLGR